MPNPWPRGKTIMIFAALLALGACTVAGGDATGQEPAMSEDVMAQLRAKAAPYQDLRTARMNPDDGCFWYRHVGPVETTMLPLLTVDGRPLCIQSEA